MKIKHFFLCTIILSNTFGSIFGMETSLGIVLGEGNVNLSSSDIQRLRAESNIALMMNIKEQRAFITEKVNNKTFSVIKQIQEHFCKKEEKHLVILSNLDEEHVSVVYLDPKNNEKEGKGVTFYADENGKAFCQKFTYRAEYIANINNALNNAEQKKGTRELLIQQVRDTNDYKLYDACGKCIMTATGIGRVTITFKDKDPNICSLESYKIDDKQPSSNEKRNEYITTNEEGIEYIITEVDNQRNVADVEFGKEWLDNSNRRAFLRKLAIGAGLIGAAGFIYFIFRQYYAFQSIFCSITKQNIVLPKVHVEDLLI